ncbi:MAG: phosphatidylinositol mannoside acyltransferase [Actinobacteria bacterium]|nr:phosphatidylinositol mannoside acyltransferase [Actinomycetota bacterium]MCZ6519535.1 phosphatidylinositol mannoside acyltransferase [Actinomycetota bacterium]MCZ6566675.1 phosphatidylinositol mannoside acyltransferase [Actinomycetota bacterium]MCZ6631754.1 phosphatidylinositol mannoside acyltransferase [Actinomycetota bacterium]
MRARLAYWGLRVGAGLVGLLPHSAVIWLGSLVGRVWYSLDGGRRRMATRHMERVLGSGSDVAGASESVMKSYGRYFAEALWVRAQRIPGLMEKTSVEGLDLVVAARDEGNGMVFSVPHLGNWEVAAPVAAKVGIPVVAVAEDLPNSRITDWFTSMRNDIGIEIVLATGRVEVMRQLEAAIADNKAVALLADRDLNGKGVEVEFFGENTTMPAGPAALAVKTGAPLFPVAAYFDGDGHRVVVRPAIEVPEGKRSDQVKKMTQSMAGEFENLILAAPDQWHLVVPNWPSDRE